MLIPARRLLTRIRLSLQDMQKTKYADYELLSALSDARTMLWIALADRFSSIPLRREPIVVEDGSAPLPDEYYTLVELSPGAHIEGDRIYSDDASVRITYNAVPRPLEETDDAVDTPMSLVIDTVEIASAIARGQKDAAVEIAMNSAQRIAQKREHAAIPDTRHFS